MEKLRAEARAAISGAVIPAYAKLLKQGWIDAIRHLLDAHRTRRALLLRRLPHRLGDDFARPCCGLGHLGRGLNDAEGFCDCHGTCFAFTNFTRAKANHIPQHAQYPQQTQIQLARGVNPGARLLTTSDRVPG